jgi:predicted NUDIX family NTP pyrophosphohydrolase
LASRAVRYSTIALGRRPNTPLTGGPTTDEKWGWMPPQSAGLLPYRFNADGELEVLVVHPGGPLWAKKDEGVWSIAKGEYASDEEPQAAADREFAEELGQPAPLGPRIDLGELRQPSGKRVHVWAVEGDVDAENVASNMFELEWPPRSGQRKYWPEVDRADWLSLGQAKLKLLKGQIGFVDRLVEHLQHCGGATRCPERD